MAGIVVVLLACAGPSAASAQSPEERGGLSVGEWDAGPVSVAGTTIRTRVIHPSSGAGPFPLVGVIHGASRNGGYHLELARTLASRGFVALVPDMPCNVTRCDHDANAAQISALLEWAVAQSATPSSTIAGLVDGTRRGLVGHSWGGLASHLAASRDASIDSLVLFDPNDDRGEGLAATATIVAPTLQLLAEVPGGCNSAWNEASITPMLPEPKLQLTVSGSGHCDPEEPGDALCGFACGSGDASTSSIFRRYAIAWTSCVLARDAGMGEWLGGARMSADEGAGRLEGVVAAGLDALPCRASPGLDAGAPDGDAGSVAPDAGSARDAAAHDAETRDAATRDAGTGASSAGGCGCSALPSSGGAHALVLLLGLLLVRRPRSPFRPSGACTSFFFGGSVPDPPPMRRAAWGPPPNEVPGPRRSVLDGPNLRAVVLVVRRRSSGRE